MNDMDRLTKWLEDERDKYNELRGNEKPGFKRTRLDGTFHGYVSCLLQIRQIQKGGPDVVIIDEE